MKSEYSRRVIAIDFDDTITEHSEYPITGDIRPRAVEVIKKLQQHYDCILWTCRSGENLIEAIKLLADKGIVFNYVNASPIGCGDGPKILADIYIDDKNFDYVVDWDRIEAILISNEGL
jgi:hydroxymethylpyrimidine pyrophosphatase-like HAD family hydrolase